MDHEDGLGIFHLIMLPIIMIANYFAGKHAGRQEVLEQPRDSEVAELRRKIEEFQRSRH